MTTDAQRLAIKAMIKRHTEAATTDQKTARETLAKEGSYTRRGKLVEALGGPKTAAA
jgi:hypothetical protein